MSSENDSGGSQVPQKAALEDSRPRFAFVTETSQSNARSHAMREHWRQRHNRNNSTKARRVQPKLLPNISSAADQGKSPNENLTQKRSSRSPGSQGSGRQCLESSSSGTDQDRYDRIEILGVPSQLLSGLGRALSTSGPDPFQTFPVQLTSQHHKLLHHWIGTHATMMFEDLDIPSFNPMKDVWFPLDLSNASSFNAIMAHAAAHLSHLYAGTSPQRGTNSADALKYKAEAVRILHEWLSDPQKALSYDAFAAVIRLLTFERYWGTAEEWNIHRMGLQRMIEAKGGIGALHDNWRLELVVYLVSLMTKPSWFEPTNNISEVSEPSADAFASDPSMDFQKIRCLWLISFIQDLRTFMGFSSRFYVQGLSTYPSLYEAVLHLRDEFKTSHSTASLTLGASPSDYDRLTCLFSICLMMQESISTTPIDAMSNPFWSSGLDILEQALMQSRGMWDFSVQNLRPFLLCHLTEAYPDGERKIDYVRKMTDVLGQVSLEARIGVEKCLLNMLCRTRDARAVFLVDDGWTPDSLLSSIHGQ